MLVTFIFNLPIVVSKNSNKNNKHYFKALKYDGDLCERFRGASRQCFCSGMKFGTSKLVSLRLI